MSFEDFIKNFDKEDTVVLLEGKRNVLAGDKKKLQALGKLLAAKTSKMIFRSGNAEGADQLFSEGVCAITNTRFQVITPYSGHRQKTNLAYDTRPLDSMDIAADREIILQSKTNKNAAAIIDKYVGGEKNRITIKAAYIIRDTVKVIGTVNIKPASFAIFYDDLLKPMSGGTGHTMNICLQNGVPLIDQRVWFNWLC